MKPIEDWIRENARHWEETTGTARVCPGLPRGTPPAAHLPSQKDILAVLDGLVALVLPRCFSVGRRPTVRRLARELHDIVLPVSRHYCEQVDRTPVADCERFARDAVDGLLRAVPDIRKMLQADIRAAYEGDPAARSELEVVLAYPGFYAIAVHRIAHRLRALGVPLLPRVMSEHAHSLTGIDIHPGATIGPGFFIDHGTGVVIGETCVIGSRVKLYQGVTLGALSFEKDENGQLVKGIKRHPDVEDNVVIYAGATILGGRTVIGRGSVIGGNVWLVHSVPPGSKVLNAQPSPDVRTPGKRRAKAARGDL